MEFSSGFLFAWVAYALYLAWVRRRVPKYFQVLLLFTNLALLTTWALASQNILAALFSVLLYLISVWGLFKLLQAAHAKSISDFMPMSMPIVLLIFARSQSHLIFFGASYMAFRLSYAAYEVLRLDVERPSFLEYLNFAFFAPTMTMGPISPLRVFRQQTVTPIPWLRIIYGGVQLLLLTPLLKPFVFSGNDVSSWTELVGRSMATYISLYLQFSGFCDIMIGVAAIFGIPVSENFDRPLFARDLLEYWRRWHITLLNYLREMMFEPLSTALFRRFGLSASHWIMPLCFFAVFLAIGLWHGLQWNYIFCSLYHATGVSLVYAWGEFRRAHKIQRQIPFPVAWLMTFLFVSMGMFFFANDSAWLFRFYRAFL